MIRFRDERTSMKRNVYMIVLWKGKVTKTTIFNTLGLHFPGYFQCKVLQQFPPNFALNFLKIHHWCVENFKLCLRWSFFSLKHEWNSYWIHLNHKFIYLRCLINAWTSSGKVSSQKWPLSVNWWNSEFKLLATSSCSCIEMNGSSVDPNWIIHWQFFFICSHSQGRL